MCCLHQIVLTTTACFLTESAIISGPDSALRWPLSCYCSFMARLVKVLVLTWCLTAPSDLCNLGTSWNEAKPGASFIFCFVLPFTSFFRALSLTLSWHLLLSKISSLKCSFVWVWKANNYFRHLVMPWKTPLKPYSKKFCSFKSIC